MRTYCVLTSKFNLLIASVLLLFSCSKEADLTNLKTGTVTDKSGNTYATVVLGNQEWMTENLKTVQFNSGDSIPEIKLDSIWNANSIAGYALYDNFIPNEAKYGKLYNFKAASSSKNSCPSGWHLPSEKEWEELISFLGGNDIAGEKLKQDGITTWFEPNDTVATNESLFNAVPGGFREQTGEFVNEKFFGYYWTATKSTDDNIKVISLHYGSTAVSLIDLNAADGASIRCTKD